jgi:hypothetical protein
MAQKRVSSPSGGWTEGDVKALVAGKRKVGKGAARLPSQPIQLLPEQSFLAVDPHLRHMACAVVEWGSEAVLDVFSLRAEKGATREELVEYWAAEGAGVALLKDIKLCVIELPDWMNKKAGNKGVQDLVSVALAASAFGLSMIMNGVRVVFIEPRDWKGGQKKAQTDAYVNVLAGANVVPKKTNQHQRDAIWMGLTWMVGQKEKSLW